MKPFSFLASLFFPPRCLLCDRIEPDRLPLPFCRPCFEAYQKEIADGCPICGKSFAVCECRPKALGDAAFIYALPYRPDRGRVRAMILSGKHRKNGVLLREYATRLHKLLQLRRVSTEDVIISYVPRSPGRYLKTGLDQAEALAVALAQTIDRPCSALLSCRLLARQQKKKSARKRNEAAKKNYSLLPNAEEYIVGRRILLVDDVATSGTTLARCRFLLLEAGAKEVICLAAAKTASDREAPLST